MRVEVVLLELSAAIQQTVTSPPHRSQHRNARHGWLRFSVSSYLSPSHNTLLFHNMQIAPRNTHLLYDIFSPQPIPSRSFTFPNLREPFEASWCGHGFIFLIDASK